MWGLDRFSTHSTPAPSPPGRNSPAPRRSLQVQRPGLAPRTSSLSLLSNVSQSNLPSTARTSVSSGLKNQIYSAPPEDIENPVTVFERLIPEALKGIEVNNNDHSETKKEKPEEFVADIDFRGQSLEDFTHAVDASAAEIPAPLEFHTTQAVEECMSSSHSHFSRLVSRSFAPS